MTHAELYEKLKNRVVFSCLAKIVNEETLNDKENIELIQQAKREWEKDAWAQGWIDGVKSIKNSKLNQNAPEPE
jgi:hypothetical protein